MKIEKELDWLQLTFPSQTYKFGVMPQTSEFQIIDKSKPLFGVYDKSYRMANGGLLMYSTDNEAVGIHVLITGDNLSWLRHNGYSSHNMMVIARAAQNVARLDYAITTDIFTVKSLEAIIDAGKYIGTTTLNSKVASGKDVGELTYYFGSPKSDKRVVIYDKAAQLNLLSVALSRIELRVRNKYANQFVENGKTIPYHTLGDNMIKRTVSIAHAGYESVLDTDANIQFDMIPRSESSLSSWIENQIKPAMENHLTHQREVVAGFSEWLQNLLDT